MILFFASGLEECPIGGWENQAQIIFDHQSQSRMPETRTCGPTIIFPGYQYTSDQEFNEAMDEAILGSPSILLS